MNVVNWFSILNQNGSQVYRLGTHVSIICAPQHASQTYSRHNFDCSSFQDMIGYNFDRVFILSGAFAEAACVQGVRRLRSASTTDSGNHFGIDFSVCLRMAEKH